MIRQACLSDANSIAKILVDAWQSAYTGIVDPAYPEKLSEEKYTAIFEQILKENREDVFVSESHSSVTGFISGVKQTGKYESQVIGLYVSPENQGIGIGSNLLDFMKGYFSSSDCVNMIIWTLLGAKSNKFYETNGGIAQEFKEIKIDTISYPGVGYCFHLKNSGRNLLY